jgi:hypothetical protein
VALGPGLEVVVECLARSEDSGRKRPDRGRRQHEICRGDF